MNTSGYINLADLMTELQTRKIAQKDFLKFYKVKPVFATASGRGYAHYIDKAGAEKIRKAVQAEQPKKMTRTSSRPHNDALASLFQEIESLNKKMDHLIQIWQK